MQFSLLRAPGAEKRRPVHEGFYVLRFTLRFLTMVWRPHLVYAAAAVVLRILRGLGRFALLHFGKLIVDAVVANIGSSTPDWEYLVGPGVKDHQALSPRLAAAFRRRLSHPRRYR